MKPFEIASVDSSPSWCPGCGDYAILKTFNAALAEAGVNPEKTVLVSGIGQAAKTPHYTDANFNVFNGLHGRALPAAIGIKCANHALEVIVTSGEGDMYGEGGNHFLHAIRRNIGLKVFVHDNQIYGLTKGQASPTSDPGFVTKIHTHGVIADPIRPLALAIVGNASLVARSFSGSPDHLKAMMLEVLRHRGGFALLDILQPCVSFNRVNTFKWYRERVKPIPASHDPRDRTQALALAYQWGDTIPIGVLYRGDRPSFESQHPALREGPLVDRLP